MSEKVKRRRGEERERIGRCDEKKQNTFYTTVVGVRKAKTTWCSAAQCSVGGALSESGDLSVGRLEVSGRPSQLRPQICADRHLGHSAWAADKLLIPCTSPSSSNHPERLHLSTFVSSLAMFLQSRSCRPSSPPSLINTRKVLQHGDNRHADESKTLLDLH